MRANTAIFVLGMHRSGTSAMMSGLQEMGVHLGDALVELDPQSGEAPLFEDARVLKIHDSILQRFDCSWQSLQPLPREWWRSAIVSDLKQHLMDLIRAEFVHQPAWGIKDPRLSLLAPLWLDICMELGSQPKFIVMFRHPAEVAQSLAKRDGVMTERAQLLWLYYSLFAEYHTRGYCRTFLSFEKLLREGSPLISSLQAVLDNQFPRQGRLHQPVDPALRHHRDDSAPESPWLAEVYGQLTAAEHNRDCLQQSRLDQLRTQFETATDLFSPIQRQQRLQIEELERGFRQAGSTAEEQQSQLYQLGDGITQAWQTISAQKSQLEDQQAELTKTVATLEQRERDLLDLNQRIDQLSRSEPSPADQDGTLHGDAHQPMKARECCDGSPTSTGEDAAEPRYQSEIDLGVVNNAHSKVYRCIEEASQNRSMRVLDVGCSTGYLGHELRNAGHEVWGVDPSPQATAEARAKLDHVYTGSIQDFFDEPEHRSLAFDFVVFGDVLEHLASPTAILARCSEFLSERGSIIASLPNVAHLAVRLMLLEGRWEYQDTGILDRSHVKFYTRDSIISTFSECGYEIVSLDPVRLPLEEMPIGVNEPLLRTVAPHITDSEQDVFQYVIQVRAAGDGVDVAAANSRFMLRRSHRILCLLPAPESTLVDIRLKAPLAKLTQLQGGEFRINSIHEIDRDDLDWSDVVVLQREANPHVLDVMTELRELNKTVIFEIDDLLTDVPAYLTVHDHCVRMRPYLEKALQMADAVTVSTEPLRHQLIAHNENTFLVPNCSAPVYPVINHYDVEADPLGEPLSEENLPAPQATLVIASSDTVRVDFIMLTLRRLLDEADPAIRLVGIGPPGRFLRKQGFEIEVHPMMEYDHFKAFLANLENAIGIIPLDDSVFNRCKSAIKYLDYSFAGIPSICSSIPPYSDVITNGSNGFLCPEDPDAWFDTIKELSSSAMLRKKIARAALVYCQREHGLYRSAAAWRNVLARCSPRPTRQTSDSKRPFQSVKRTLIGHLLRPKSYHYALRLLKYQGMSGVVSRVRSLV
jgi:2-polyprenyl-3-methyl-5-hydroxy-6-metoxy-1,4-benzoquinol methylase/glycosyltransferase involved in cell wall biosynthesis|tara:strand:- start:4683 stop:7790 length:3108 start_codon:yes stop_codon:yes gene_type:complete